MSLMASDTGGSNYTPPPEGTHIALCNQVVDLGLQRTTYLGEDKITHQVYIRWELPNERFEWEKDGEKLEGPMVIGKTYTLSLSNKANLYKDLTSWRGRTFTDEELKGFDLFTILGKPCQVTITHWESGGRSGGAVASVAGIPKGMEGPTTSEIGLIKYSADEPEAFETLSKWMQEKIMDQVVDEAGEPPEPEKGDPGADLDDEIPF